MQPPMRPPIAPVTIPRRPRKDAGIPEARWDANRLLRSRDEQVVVGASSLRGDFELHQAPRRLRPWLRDSYLQRR